MIAEQTLQNVEKVLAPWSKETSHPDGERLDAIVTAGDLRAAVRALHDTHSGYLSAITGIDLGPEAGRMEALYHFAK